jgi:putative transposase
MAIPIRHSNSENVTAGARTFFVTSSIADKRNLLQSDRAAGLFIRTLYEYRAQGKFRLHEFVVMPDHFHVLITVEAGMTVERAVQFIKGGFAFRAGNGLAMRAPVWQKGFSDARVLTGEAFAGMRQYVHNNPVKRGLVSEPSQFPHSSAHYGFELDPVPPGLKPVSFPDALRHG